MRVSTLFGETLRASPGDTESGSHQLLLRAGYVRQLATGVYSYLTLAQRSLSKITAILRSELDAIGGQEINMPVVHPAEIWQQSGRWSAVGEELVRFKDRRGRDMALAMTHEEVVASLASSEVRSYRQLPMLVYQLQTKFRDEPRARGGLIRTREFVMKDSYSLDRDEAGLIKQYIAHYNAYLRIGARVGLPLLPVGGDVGMMGGKAAHEFMYLTPIGEDTLVICDACGYAANREVARFVKQPLQGSEPQSPSPALEKAHTPGTTTIEALTRSLGVDERQTAKVVLLMGEFAGQRQPKLIMAVVRGDMEVNLTPIFHLSGAKELRPAQADEIQAAGIVPGFASPIGIDRTRALVIVDDLVTASPDLVVGANEPDYHFLHARYGRDFTADVVGHIAAAYEGAACVRCGGPLRLARGVEVGNIFQLGTLYSEPMGAMYTDEEGARHPIVMGSYGIGVGRLLACVAEEYHDDRGLTLPISVAPFHVMLVSLAQDDNLRSQADDLYLRLRNAGVETLYDDRDVSAGTKFADADLRGIPVRVTLSDRSLKRGGVEITLRSETESRYVAVSDAVTGIHDEIGTLQAAVAERLASVQPWREAGV